MNSKIREEIKRQGMRIDHRGGRLNVYQGNSRVMRELSMKAIGAILRDGEREAREIMRSERARLAK